VFSVTIEHGAAPAILREPRVTPHLRGLHVAPFMVVGLWLLMSVGIEIYTSLVTIFTGEGNPWEYGIVFDAWRVIHGANPYSANAVQATHVYGALTTYLYAPLVWCFGPNLVAPRLLSFGLALATVALILRIVAKGSTTAVKLVGWFLLLNVFTLTGHLVEVRPSMLSLFFGILALVILGGATSSGQIWPGVLGSLVAVLAFLFKQTAAMVAIVPSIWLVTYGRGIGMWTKQRVVIAMMPLLALGLIVLVMRIAAPVMFFNMLVALTKFRIIPSALITNSVILLKDLPLFFVVLIHWLVRHDTTKDQIGSWLVVTVVVTAGAGILAASKVGGEANSLMFPLLAAAAFVVWHGPHALNDLLDHLREPKKREFALSLGLCAIVSTGIVNGVPRPPSLEGARVAKQGRETAVRAVRELSGRVICPEDPLIPVQAGRPGNVVAVFELDIEGMELSRNVPIPLPSRLSTDIGHADHVLTVKDGFFASLFPVWNAALLADLSKRGFVEADCVGRYCVWSRVPKPS
jgi:hypothetical protein